MVRGGKEDPIRDYDTRIPPPRACIRDYCLMHCERKGRKNSKRDAATCIETDCPLHPYRTGVLKGRTGPISEWAKQKRLSELEQARRGVTKAERALDAEKETLMKKKSAVEVQQRNVTKAERMLSKQKKIVRDLEIEFNKQLEAGLWHSRKNMREEQSAPGAGTQGPDETSAASTAPEDS